MGVSKLTAILVISSFLVVPAIPGFDGYGGAAFAKSEKAGGNGNGNGNGGGNKGGNGGGNNAGGKTKAAASPADVVRPKASPKGKPVTTASAKVKGKAAANGMHPSELGKMNGAMNANINAVLAHIRNGQTTNGPVGLMAGLAVADSAALDAATTLEELQLAADAADENAEAVDTALQDQGFASLDDYLAAVADGTATEEEMAAIDAAIDAAGGLNEDGTALAETGPTPEEIAAAEDAAMAAAADVATAEGAIGDAWNKDGDLDALLVALRDRLALYDDQISATLAAPEVPVEGDEVPVEEVVIE